MKQFKKIIALALALVLSLSLAACASKTETAASTETASTETASETTESKGTITVAASPTPHAEILAQAKPILEAEGWTLEVKEFQDYVQPNNVVESGEFDANYWPGIPATVLFLDGEALCFGTADGRLCRFGTNVDNAAGYNDDGTAIDAYWETSDFDGKIFFHVKTFTGVAVRLAAAVNTGVVVYAQVRGIWKQVFSSGAKARYFDWGYIDFGKFTFSTDRTPRTLFGKIKIKKADKVRFRLQNNALNEPFGLYAFGLQFKEPGGNYKR